MKPYAPLLVALLAVPALAQTSTDGDASAAADSQELSTRVGTTFYSDDAMTTLRTGDEITAGWATLSAADQDLLRARCTELNGMEPTKGGGDAAGATDGSASGEVPNDATGTTTAEDMGFIADDVRMKDVCAAISGL